MKTDSNSTAHHGSYGAHLDAFQLGFSCSEWFRFKLSIHGFCTHDWACLGCASNDIFRSHSSSLPSGILTTFAFDQKSEPESKIYHPK